MGLKVVLPEPGSLYVYVWYGRRTFRTVDYSYIAYQLKIF